MPIERIPVVASVDPEANTEVYYESGELSVNTMYDKYTQDRFYATQRPSIKTIATDRDFVQETNDTWDASEIEFDSGQIHDVTSEEGAPREVFFKTDGTKMYVLGAFQELWQYSLSTAWDLTTVSYDSVTETVDGRQGIFFKPDGTKAYFCDNNDANISEYSLSTPWDISTLSLVNVFDGSDGGNIDSGYQVFFKPDGTKMYLLERDNTTSDGIMHQYSLSTEWDTTTASYDNKSFNAEDALASGSYEGFGIKDDGTSWFVLERSRVYEMVMSTPWDISTSSYTGRSFSTADETSNTLGLYVRPDGTKMFTIEGTNDTVLRYSMPFTQTTVESGSTENGRALYHWEKTQQSYIVINGTLYIDGTSELASISEGLEKCFFIETDDYLVLLDPENNEGWTIDEANVVEKITDEDFPPNFATPEQLAGGGAWVDGFLFILTEEGFVWNSVINDPRSWNALNFLGADRMSDEGVYLSRHAEGLVAIGTRSTEFFYNAGLETGSPLTRRQDLSYYVGCPNRNYVFNTGETVYFIGNEEVGSIGAFTINKYQLEKVSNRTIDTLLSTSFNDKGTDFLVTGAMVTNHLLFFVSALIAGDTSYTAEYSLVFDVFADKWTRYESNILDNGHFPIVGFAGRLRDRTTNTVVLFVNAEYGQMTLDYTVQDFLEGGPYFAEGVDYIEDQEDYVQSLEGDDAVVPFTIRLGEVDFDTMTNKFVYRTEVVGTTLADSQGLDPIQVRWSDDHYNTFTEYRNLDTSFRSKLTRCGKFRRRAHEIHYEGVEPLRIEGIELYLRGSSYA